MKVDEEYTPLYYSFSNRSSTIVVQIAVNEAQLPMQLDMGASLSIISEAKRLTIHCGHLAATPALQDVQLKTSVIPVVGVLQVTVAYKD